MQTFIVFFLKSAACSGILFAWYLLFLQNKKLHNYNRMYLLAATALSLIVPFLQFRAYEVHTTASQPIALLDPGTGADYIEPIGVATARDFPLAQVSVGLYLLVSFVLLSLLLFRLAWLRRIRSKGVPATVEGRTIIYTDCQQAPFSFGNTLYWRQDIEIDSPAGEQILKHELHHIAARHTADKIFMQLALCLAWANPFLWFIKKELAMQHEFSADDAAITDRDTDSFARMILQAKYSSLSPDIIHPFFHSSIKRRLTMLTLSKTTRFSFLRRAMLLPLVASVLMLLSFKVTVSEVNVARKSISVVFDAGHGGKDNGATGLNGLKEKDMNLKICKKLVQLAPEYNIKADLTRSDDSYPTLDERVTMSENRAPDVFISIHVNASTANSPTNNYEIVFAGRNPYPQESRLLGSAITARLRSLQIAPAFTQRGLHVVNMAKRPALLIECGDISNADDVARINNDKKLEQFCREILSGIADYQNNKK